MTADHVLVPMFDVAEGQIVDADAAWLMRRVGEARISHRRTLEAWLEIGERLWHVREQMGDRLAFGAWCRQYHYFGSADRTANLSDAMAAYEYTLITNGNEIEDTSSFRELASRQRQIEKGETPEQKDEWYTPAWVFELLGLTFDLDVCAPVDPDKRRVPAAQVYTAEDDGLTQPWHGLVWCNPPYSAPSPWIDKWAAHPDGLILTHASVRAKRTLALWAGADAIVMFSKMYFTRPSGADEDINLLLQLAARGQMATEALRRVATAGPYAGPMWVPA